MSETKKYEIEVMGYWNYYTVIDVEEGEDPHDVAYDVAMSEVPYDVEIDTISVSEF